MLLELSRDITKKCLLAKIVKLWEKFKTFLQEYIFKIIRKKAKFYRKKVLKLWEKV